MAEQSRPRLAGPSRPLGDPDIPQFYVPANKPAGKVVYAPRLYGAATIVFADKRRGVNETRRVAFLVPVEPGVRTIDWETATPAHLTPANLQTAPPGAGEYMPLPAAAMTMLAFTRWAKSFDRWLARTQRVILPAPTKADEGDAPAAIAPKRGGVNVELVAIVWEMCVGNT